MEKTIYKNTYFRIECGYMCGDNDRTEECLQELQSQLECAGWTIDTRRSPGDCPEASLGKSHLYCHPTSVSGPVDETLIKPLEDIFRNGKSYIFRATDVYEEVHDFTWEELEQYHRNRNRNTIELLLLESFKTKRSNLYKPVDAVIEYVTEKICVHTFLKKNSYLPADVERNYVKELFRNLCDEGHFRLAKGKSGSPIARTAFENAPAVDILPPMN